MKKSTTLKASEHNKVYLVSEQADKLADAKAYALLFERFVCEKKTREGFGVEYISKTADLMKRKTKSTELLDIVKKAKEAGTIAKIGAKYSVIKDLGETAKVVEDIAISLIEQIYGMDMASIMKHFKASYGIEIGTKVVNDGVAIEQKVVLTTQKDDTGTTPKRRRGKGKVKEDKKAGNIINLAEAKPQTEIVEQAVTIIPDDTKLKEDMEKLSTLLLSKVSYATNFLIPNNSGKSRKECNESVSYKQLMDITDDSTLFDTDFSIRYTEGSFVSKTLSVVNNALHQMRCSTVSESQIKGKVWKANMMALLSNVLEYLTILEVKGELTEQKKNNDIDMIIHCLTQIRNS